MKYNFSSDFAYETPWYLNKSDKLRIALENFFRGKNHMMEVHETGGIWVNPILCEADGYDYFNASTTNGSR